MSRIWVKVCGLTREEDVAAAVDSGADAVGLVLVGRSPRLISVARAAELAAVAPDRVEVVVLVEGDPAAALAQAGAVAATGVQPYGSNAHAIATAALESGRKVLFPVPVVAGTTVDVGIVPHGAWPLLDTAVGGATGGTGRSFDWTRARDVPDAVIAGGLDPENVAAALASSGAAGVDASSGLETAVGVKDHVKVAAFVAAARAAGE